MYRFFETHGDTMRLTPVDGDTYHKVFKLDSIKQINFRYDVNTKRKYINPTIYLNESGEIVSKDDSHVRSIEATYRINEASHWDETTSFDMERPHIHEKDGKLSDLTKTVLSGKSLAWEILNAERRRGTTTDLFGNLVLSFIGSNGELGRKLINHNFIGVKSSDTQIKLDELYAQVYSDIDLFFGVTESPEECYIKED